MMNSFEHKVVEILSEELTKKEVIDLFKKEKDVEKRMREVATEVIMDLFRTLYQQRNLIDNNLKK